MHILNSICGRQGKDLELEPLKDSPHYGELNSMLHARFAVAGLRGAAERWLAGEKGALLSHLPAIKAPGANLRKVAIQLGGFDDEDAANEIMLGIVQPSLVELCFQCEAFTVLPQTISNCTRLTELNLNCCTGLTVLPEAISNCTSLTVLNLSGCTGLTALPEVTSNCTSLTTLYLDDCTGLTALPGTISNCTSLTKLNLSGCTGLTALPEAIGNCTSLTELYLQDCTGLTALPETIGNCTSLTELYLSGCTGLRKRLFLRLQKLGSGL